MTNIWKERLSKNGTFDVELAKSEAEQIFDRGFMSLMTNFTSIRSFRKVITRGIPAVAPDLQRENLGFLTGLLRSAVGGRYFADPQKILREQRHVELARLTTDTVVQTTSNVTDAASIIFGHAILDATLFDFCTACAIVAPFDWLRFIGSRKISLDELHKHPKLDLLGDVLAAALEDFERESLLKKADRLFALCQPPADHQGVIGYTYNRERLEQIDRLRHDIVHRIKIKDPIPKCDELLLYLDQTGFHLMSLPNHKYDLRLPSLGTGEKTSPDGTPKPAS
jgi:hypothetical protein